MIFIKLILISAFTILASFSVRAETPIFSDGFEKILVDGAVPDNIGIGKGDIKIIETTKNHNKIKFNVDSKVDVPILIKISYFPNWKAYVNGKETKVYKASPYLMLVYGKGEIELRYEKLFVDYIGIILTFIGFIVVVYISVFSFFHHKKRKK